jgi:hypothetical protein
MASVIEDWHLKTTKGKLTWFQARLASKATIGKTLMYPLPAIALSSKECTILQRHFQRAILGKMGVVRTAPSLLATAPPSLGGFGLFSFEIEQLSAHVSILLLHGPDKASITGSLLRSTLETYALESGLPGDPLAMHGLEYVTANTWIHQTIQAMHKYNITLHSDIDQLKVWMQSDTFIMQAFRRSFSARKLGILNKVRLHLRVVTFSDLISADGKHIDTQLLHGNRGIYHPTPSFHAYHWPQVPPPSSSEKSLWYQALCLVFNISHPDQLVNTNLRNKKWLTHTLEHAQWQLDYKSNLLYQRTGKGSKWTRWKPTTHPSSYSTRATSNPYIVQDIVNELPYHCSLISVTQRGPFTYIANTGHLSMESNNTQLPRVSIAHNNLFDHPSEMLLLYHISLHNGYIFTDGSNQDDKATYAVVIQPPDLSGKPNEVELSTIHHFTGIVHGSEEDINSYRAELAGILAAIQYVVKLCTAHKCSRGSCKIYCDNKGALAAAFGSKRPTPRWASYDIVHLIRRYIRESPIRLQGIHIKGHQDTSVPFHQLPYPAKGNVLADTLASTALRQLPSRNISLTPPGPWSLALQGGLIGGNVHHQIKQAIYRPLMEKRWTTLFGLEEHHLSKCDWDLFFHSIRTQQSNIRYFFVKFNAKLLPVGINLKRRRHSESEACPCCGEDESHLHLLHCKHNDMVRAANQCLDDIEDFLAHDTDPSIQRNIPALIRHYIHGHSHQPTLDIQTDHIFCNQLVLGEQAFFAGLWDKHWLEVQQAFHTQGNRRTSAITWTTKLIHKLQQIPFLLWHIRNDILHKQEDNFATQEQHNALNNIIDDLFKRKPHQRHMAHSDALYFTKYGSQQLKNMKIQRKTNWIAGANLIITKYERTSTTQSARFRSYFQWDKG